ncbi:MAG: FixH family protein [Xanthobacteraceae bacterium]|nr:FixH family protein [Xanthobacteraceae bacterium]
MTEARTTQKPLTGRFVLIVTLAFFAVVIGVNIVMMRLAISTLPGTEVDSAYKASLAYQGEINAAHDQDARSWKVDARIERRPDGAAALRVEAHDRDGQPLTGLAFSGRLERPADQRQDKLIAFAELDKGEYGASATDVAPGQWELVIEGDLQGKRVFLSRNRVVLN